MKQFNDIIPSNARDQIEINLLKGRIHLLSGEIGQDNSDDCIKWILSENISSRDDQPLHLYINSTGGDLYSTFAIIDIIKTSTRPVYTYGIGAVMSAAFLIFACGEKGYRYAHRNCGFMIHQYSGAVEGKHHDLKASVKEMEQSNDRMITILGEATPMSKQKIKSIFLPPSDVFLTADEVCELGVADVVIK